MSGEPGRVQQVQQLAEAALVHVVAVEDAGECGGQARVGAHDELHGFVDELSDDFRGFAGFSGEPLAVLGEGSQRAGAGTLRAGEPSAAPTDLL
ncbi:hypothetical protein [Paenarthrobacter sp. PH39-S1]|uniref:hypothetical protein n=1 Tax=Paenarthrobacter sp. PH39-S1 TaxID=3046204 RepID=UPI0032D99205